MKTPNKVVMDDVWKITISEELNIYLMMIVVYLNVKNLEWNVSFTLNDLHSFWKEFKVEEFSDMNISQYVRNRMFGRRYFINTHKARFDGLIREGILELVGDQYRLVQKIIKVISQ